MARKWIRWIAWEIPLLAITIAAGLYWRNRPAAESRPVPLGLRLLENRTGQIGIAWDPKSAVARKAIGGRIDINDGIERQSIPLTAEMISSGNYSYARASEDVGVRLVLVDDSGARHQESSRFAGQPLEIHADSPQAGDLQTRRAELDALARTNRIQAERIQRLTAELSAIETRLGIGGAKLR